MFAEARVSAEWTSPIKIGKSTATTLLLLT
jgi:hypothetical protein